MKDSHLSTTKRAPPHSAIALFFLLFSFTANALPIAAPPGVGPLPDGGDSKVGAVVTKAHIDKYRTVLPPEVAALVTQGQFAFEALLRPRTADLFSSSPQSGEAAYQVDERGALSPAPTDVSGRLFPGEAGAVGERVGSAEAFKILWNAATHPWRLKAFTANLSLNVFNLATDTGRRVDFTASRIYPAALGLHPGTLTPLFREKISAAAPAALSGLTWLTLRFLGTDPDYMWGASPITAEVRQLTGSNRSDPFFPGAFAPDDLFVWSGKVEGVQPTGATLLPMLVPIVEGPPSTQGGDVGGCVSTEFSKSSALESNISSKRFEGYPNWVPTNVRMVLRNVWRLELLSRDPFSLDARQTLYVDEESSLPIYRVVFGADGEIRKIIIGILGVVGRESVGVTGWRAEVLVTPSSSSVAVISMTKLLTCSKMLPGQSLKDFDPSHIASVSDKGASPKGGPKPTPVVEAEPVDE